MQAAVPGCFVKRWWGAWASKVSTGDFCARFSRAALFAPRDHAKKDPKKLCAFWGFISVPVVGVEPTRCHHQRILSYSSHSEPNGLNRNKTVFSVTFQNIKNPKKPYKISIFDAKHQKYKQFVPSSIIGSQIPNLRRWRDVGGM
jgi:hypothetical protein